MGVKCTNTQQELDKMVLGRANIIREEILRTLQYLGEQCNKRIRDRSKEESWIDRTGNLRSSIGYAVFAHGKREMESAFKVVMEGKEGTETGRQYVRELATEYAKVYALVVVAGMSYAEYVEAIESKDVLASTELWARAKIEDYMKRTQERAEKRINKFLAAA